MLLINGMIYLNSNNKTIFIDKMSDVLLKQKNFSIPRNRKYRIGIDQSTTCTGIYIEDTNEDFSAILEIPRNKDLTKNMYFLELTQFLNYIFNERELDVVVYELPVPNMKQTTSYKTLTELKGKLDQWLASNITFCNVKTIGLYPQSWKSKVLNKGLKWCPV